MGNSLKKTVIQGFTFALTVDDLNTNKINLVTSFGLISGRIANEDMPTESEQTDNPLTPDQTTKIYNSILNASLRLFDSEAEGSDGYIHLMDATIRANGNTTYNVGNIVVFHDQIIGVFLGNLD